MFAQEPIHQLWDQLALYPVTETRAACNHLMRTVARWIDADKPGWIGVVRFVGGRKALQDPMVGWRLGAIQFLEPFNAKEMALAQDSLSLPRDQPRDPGMASRALALRSGTFRAHRMRDGFVDYEAFAVTDHYRRFYTDLDIRDRIWIGFPAGADAESFFIFDRRSRSKGFTKKDLMTAAYALRGLMWFHRRLLLEHGLTLVQKPLTPQERRILHHLLSGLPIKEIAAAMVQSPYTTGDHIKEVYRKYAVQSRSELMALWLKTW